MKTALLAAALLMGAAGPAWAERVNSYYGLTDSEMSCLREGSHTYPRVIVHCEVPPQRVAAAMDWLMTIYANNNHPAMPWIDEHCEAKPAIPRNKWVCTDAAEAQGGDLVTREYR
jgi:hypothetical protein